LPDVLFDLLIGNITVTEYVISTGNHPESLVNRVPNAYSWVRTQ